MKVYVDEAKTGITRTEEFERKRLALYGVNVGRRCGHDCIYCSTPVVYRRLPVFQQIGQSPFGHGYCVVDPGTPDRVARDARRIRKRGLIQLCTLTDAWAPEAQQHDLGRRCLQAILSSPGWSVRILTKNAAVKRDFDVIAAHRDRVLLGLSITATPGQQHAISILEPYASPIEERMAVLSAAALSGFRTYGMLCPLLPGIADGPEQIDELVRFAAGLNVEEIFAEPVNPRGCGVIRCQEALTRAGYQREALAIERIRHRDGWSAYVAQLITNIQNSVRRHLDIAKLRFLLYPSNLLPQHVEQIRRNDAGVVWLG